jgi:hypothetical protein
MTSISLYGAYQAPEEGFVAPRFGHPKDRRPDLKQVLAGLEVAAAAPVDHLAERDQHKPAEQRGSYRVVEDTMTIAGRRTTDPVLRLRRVFVWSSARAQAAATARARKLDRARDDLGRLTRGLGSRHYPTVDKVQARLAAEQATDGWYALLTNLDPPKPTPPRSWPATRARRSSSAATAASKAHLAVAPMLLQSNRRIQALVTVICLALLVFCLVERQVRRAIAPDLTLQGLYVGQPAKPTGRLVFEALARLRLIPASGHDPPVIPRPHRCKPDCCTCWTSTPPKPPDQPEDPMDSNGSNNPRLVMCEGPG